MKLIKLSEDHYVVVDDTEIKEGDWCYRDTNIVLQVTQELLDYYSSIKSTSKHKAYKITHSTQPIEFGWGQEGRDFVSKKVYDKVKPISLSEVKELLGVVDVETRTNYFSTITEEPQRVIGYVLGYNQALEDNKERKYTEEDMIEWAMCMIAQYVHGNTNIWNKDLLRESLPQPQTEWDVEFDEHGKLTLV